MQAALGHRPETVAIKQSTLNGVKNLSVETLKSVSEQGVKLIDDLKSDPKEETGLDTEETFDSEETAVQHYIQPYSSDECYCTCNIEYCETCLGTSLYNPQPQWPTWWTHKKQCIPLWHRDSDKVGFLSKKGKIFHKQRKGGAISLVYERVLRDRGIHGYKYKILEGTITAADGIGFVFADKLPYSKNVQHIWSIFVNRIGQVCYREAENVVKVDTTSLLPLKVGMEVTMVVNLNRYTAFFQMVDLNNTYTNCSFKKPKVVQTTLSFERMANIIDCSKGYVCAVVTGGDVCVQLEPASIEASNYLDDDCLNIVHRNKPLPQHLVNELPHPLYVLLPPMHVFNYLLPYFPIQYYQNIQGMTGITPFIPFNVAPNSGSCAIVPYGHLISQPILIQNPTYQVIPCTLVNSQNYPIALNNQIFAVEDQPLEE
ncbi:uncharacterized protein CMU_031280 [Cryptosporidium muris RN66]|uniref:Uncharacterized protein n=1 Tax=Cryptosporidium muris (strain RN66) TaxID=441375 RepID=B6AIE6_CRYMR|nr:uncharacterized protein CMU_031280 [Cryptosporidium muris RN66]EEA07987.1 hypothetical protein CMU_031280 [Cryptosporidium muris RN66]|eukprot:XP_002142336.1 hypothetical protein [Cryptosporidium muris RN66]